VAGRRPFLWGVEVRVGAQEMGHFGLVSQAQARRFFRAEVVLLQPHLLGVKAGSPVLSGGDGGGTSPGFRDPQASVTVPQPWKGK
jgi:hypothetical protein